MEPGLLGILQKMKRDKDNQKEIVNSAHLQRNYKSKANKAKGVRATLRLKKMIQVMALKEALKMKI